MARQARWFATRGTMATSGQLDACDGEHRMQRHGEGRCHLSRIPRHSRGARGLKMPIQHLMRLSLVAGLFAASVLALACGRTGSTGAAPTMIPQPTPDQTMDAVVRGVATLATTPLATSTARPQQPALAAAPAVQRVVAQVPPPKPAATQAPPSATPPKPRATPVPSPALPSPRPATATARALPPSPRPQPPTATQTSVAKTPTRPAVAAPSATPTRPR